MRYKSAWYWFIVLIIFDQQFKKFDEKGHLNVKHEKYEEN